VSSTPWTVDADPAGPRAEPPATDAPPAAQAHWRGWAEVRSDLRISLRVALLVALAGLPAGLLWWALAPRVVFLVTDAGPEPVGDYSDEFRVADDAVLALVLLGIGLVVGVATWFLSRRRGVGAVLALAVGGSLAAVLAWQLGEVLGAGPSEAQATEGARLMTALQLGSLPVLALAPFAALLGYLAATVCAPDDGLGRTAEGSGAARVPLPAAERSAMGERSPVDAPPPGRPSA
jgi:hypothetical protein